MDTSNVKVGDIFWRQVNFNRYERPRMAKLSPRKSDHGGVIFRAWQGEGFVKDKDTWTIMCSDRRGLICLCYFTLPSDLSTVIGFRVCRISNAKTSVCVMPVLGTLDELLTHYNPPKGC